MELMIAGDSRNALVYARTFSSHGLRSTAMETCGPIKVCASSREKSGARPSAVSTFTSLPVLILISASDAARYCLSVSSQIVRRRISASSSMGTGAPGPPLAICRSPTLCELSSSYLPVRTGHIGALRLRDGIAHVVDRRVQRAQRIHRALQLCL